MNSAYVANVKLYYCGKRIDLEPICCVLLTSNPAKPTYLPTMKMFVFCFEEEMFIAFFFQFFLSVRVTLCCRVTGLCVAELNEMWRA